MYRCTTQTKLRFSETSVREIINIDDDGGEEIVVGRISAQQTRVFVMFALAFVLSGLCSAYANLHHNTMALATGALALALIVTMFTEAQRGK